MEVKKIDRRQIIEELKEKGYTGKSIEYEELKELYRQYGYGMKESDFAQAILGVSYGNYSTCKYNGKKVRILKEPKTELAEEAVEKIIKELKEKGYTGKSITYEELKELHREYGSGLVESDFAQKILGISYSNYGSCKNRGTKVRVLKEPKIELEEEEVQKRIQALKKKGYAGKLITYEELQKIHREYGNRMLESDFAQTILGITQGNYYSCKNKGTKVRILKEPIIELEYEEIESIIEILIQKGYEGKKISYEELQKLHKEYGNGMSESDFAQTILSISYSKYMHCKHQGRKVKILKRQKAEVTQEKIKKKKEQLKKKGYGGKSISYEDLQALHREYGNEMSEIDFAEVILGISYGNYSTCKYNGTRAIVLKEPKPELKQGKVETIMEQLKEKGYIGKLISYKELQALHREYGKEMREIDFAQTILGISVSTYNRCKRGATKKVKILKNEKELPQEEVRKKIQELKEKGYTGKTITYAELQKLHKQYGKGMSEIDFAEKILGITQGNYYNCRKKGTTIRIINDKKTELEQEEVQKIIQELKEKGYIGKAITYEELQQLHKEYGNGMRERNFAEVILGISYNSYGRCKYKGMNAIVKDSIVYNKAKEIIQLYVNRPDMYSKELINNICKEYDISIEDFIVYVVIKSFGDISHMLEAMEENKGLWIGKIRLSEEFANRNIDLITKIATQIVNRLWNKYIKKGDKEDYIQEVILYMIENMGEVELNFGHNLDLFEHVIYVRTNKYCKGIMVQEFKATSRLQSFTRISKRGNGEEFEMQIPDNSVNIEQQIIQRQVPSEFIEESYKCIRLLSQHIEEGCDREEAIAMTADEMNIDASTMLEYMQQYLITKGKVKITPKGEVDWDLR